MPKPNQSQSQHQRLESQRKGFRTGSSTTSTAFGLASSTSFVVSVVFIGGRRGDSLSLKQKRVKCYGGFVTVGKTDILVFKNEVTWAL
ncbi:hypothetical protein BDZ45DRAFT_739159 [Acephala macrosclerotiorum]|nr:hypothetical protein BDZ45DRAFT_739159 [Acephala macrosclerotiorum]